MRRQQSTDGFNKEKFAFLVASFIFAAGTYQFLSTGPVELVVGNPISTQPGPGVLRNVTAEHPAAENFYVVTGSKTRMIDPLTRQLVNRDRKSPFTRADWVSAKPEKAVTAKNTPPPPPPPPPPAVANADETKTKKKWDGVDTEAEVSFVGVMMMSGQTYGMVKPKDGGPAKQVKIGDKIPDYNYIVTKIEKQAIWIEDENKRPFLLKDNQFIAADTTGRAKAEAEEEEPAPKKKTEKPATKEKKTEKPAKTEPAKPAAKANDAADKADVKTAHAIMDAAHDMLTKAIAGENDPLKKAKLQAKLQALDKHTLQKQTPKK